MHSVLLALAALAAPHGGPSSDGVLRPRAEDAADFAPEELVNTLGGTDSTSELSRGNVLPLVAQPWAFNAWSPMTVPPDGSDNAWWFHPDSTRFYGIRCTHQPSPWINDYGQFIINAGLGERTPQQPSEYSSRHSTFRPHLFRARLSPLSADGRSSWFRSAASSGGSGGSSDGDGSSDGTLLELTSTSHGAVVRATFPPWDRHATSQSAATRRVHVVLPSSSGYDAVPGTLTVEETGAGLGGGLVRVRGTSTAESGGVPNRECFGHHFDLTIEASGRGDGRPPLAWGVVRDGKLVSSGGGKPSEDRSSSSSSSSSSFASGLMSRFFGSGGGGSRDEVGAASDRFSSEYGAHYAWVDFAPDDPAADELTIRVGTSFLSAELAALTRERQLGARSFDEVADEARRAWRETLSAVEVLEVGDGHRPAQTSGLLTGFYTSLYRGALFPRLLSETDADGQEVHYSPYATSRAGAPSADARHGGRSSGTACAPRPGPVATDSGFWDAYRAVYPQLSLLYPAQLGRLVQGWVNAYVEGGWLPSWASPGYRGSMVGSMGDVTLADAIVKRIPGFNVTLAYEAIRKDAFVAPSAAERERGREGLDEYVRHGYIPSDARPYVSEEVSRSLNYYLSDFAISRAAEALGRTEDAAALAARAAKYALLFDNRTGFFRPKLANGSVARVDYWGVSAASTGGPHAPADAFDPFEWGNGFTEGGPWQYRFSAEHDPKGLARLYAAAGLDMCAELEAAMTSQPTYHTGSYGSVIHEMVEMGEHAWGQYAHNDQPAHHMLWMFIAMGSSVRDPCAHRGQAYLRRAMTELYPPAGGIAGGFAGDEDNGEMGSWLVLSALGLYSLAPGTPDYVLGSPLFKRVRVRLGELGRAAGDAPRARDAAGGGARALEIVATNLASPKHVYVDSVSLNGEQLRGTSVRYEQLMAGGTLEFVMTDKPNFAPGPMRGGKKHRHRHRARHQEVLEERKGDGSTSRAGGAWHQLGEKLKAAAIPSW